jgi:hypothetical protein
MPFDSYEIHMGMTQKILYFEASCDARNLYETLY